MSKALIQVNWTVMYVSQELLKADTWKLTHSGEYPVSLLHILKYENKLNSSRDWA